MPSPKRWFHLNRDINDDPEFDELCRQFGVAGIRVFLEVMGTIDKTENEWRVGEAIESEWKVSERIERHLAKKCRTKLNITHKILQWMFQQSWIIVATLPDKSSIITAPNYRKYNKNWVQKWELSESPPFLAFPCLSKEEKKKEEGVVNSVNSGDLDNEKLETLNVFFITPELREWNEREGLELDLDAELIRFKEYHVGHSLRKLIGDINQLFMGWCLTSKDSRMGKLYKKIRSMPRYRFD